MDDAMGKMEDVAETAKDVAKSAADAAVNAANTIQDAVVKTNNTLGGILASVPTQASDSTTGLATSDLDSPSVVADSSSSASYSLNPENRWGWVTLYVVTIVLALLLNLLFVVASLCTRRTRTTGYYLLLNLSIRDILLAALCMPFALNYEIVAYTWNFGHAYCVVYRFCYHCFLFFLPLTLLFISWHLLVENCKWSFAGEEGHVPRPWPHTIFIPLVWLFSLLLATPTVFYSAVRKEKWDIYRNLVEARPKDALVCMHRGDDWLTGSLFFAASSHLLTFALPLLLLIVPFKTLLVQACGCCTRRLRSSEFWLSLFVPMMILFYVASRAPFELFNLHYFLTQYSVIKLEPFLPFLDDELYKALMKWAVFAPCLLNPLLYFTFSPEARHGVFILFARLCSCCCSKGDMDVEVASDDEKGRMLAGGGRGNDDTLQQNATMDGGAGPAGPAGDEDAADGGAVVDDPNVPLQSKQEEEM